MTERAKIVPSTNPACRYNAKSFFYKHISLIYCLILVIVTIIVYANNIRNDFVDLDDNVEITDNAVMRDRSLRGAIDLFVKPKIYGFYYPVKNLTYYVTSALSSNTNPFYFHLGNDLLHLFNVLCCYIFLYLLTKKHRFAFLTALLFAVYPCHSDSINRITCRGHLLAGLFSFLSLIFYLMRDKAEDTAVAGAQKHGQRLFLYFASILTYALGLLSHPDILPLPIILFLYEAFIRNAADRFRERIKTGLLATGPFFLLMLCNSVLISIIFKPRTSLVFIGNAYHLSSLYRSIGLFYEYVVNAVFIPDTVMGGAVFLPLYTDFHFYILRLTVLMVLFCMVFMVGWLERYMLIAPLIVISFLAPGILFINTDSPLALRYLYFPSVGVSMLLMWAVDKLFSYAGYDKPFGLIVRSAGILLFLLFALSSYQRNIVWRTSWSLWSGMSQEKTPNRATGFFRLAKLERIKKNYKSAASFLKMSQDSLANITDYNFPGYKRRVQDAVDRAMKINLNSMASNTTKRF